MNSDLGKFLGRTKEGSAILTGSETENENRRRRDLALTQLQTENNRRIREQSKLGTDGGDRHPGRQKREDSGETDWRSEEEEERFSMAVEAWRLASFYGVTRRFQGERRWTILQLN
ncbi:PPC domain-containing protein [Psidium guajava]|nr:PPC domain-containing protein [Psidium guajava]